jgi:hypothetical protein
VLAIDAIGGEPSHCLAAKAVVSDASDQRYVTARASGSDRLVRTLTPRRSLKRASEYGFARLWNARELNDHIGVGTAHDNQF